MTPLSFGSKAPEVLILQESLLRLGYSLPRYGADGILGRETLYAVLDYQQDHPPVPTPDAFKAKKVDASLFAAIVGEPTAFSPLRLVSPEDKGARFVRWREWTDIQGITLHQTATAKGEEPENFRSMCTHLACTSKGKALLVHNLNAKVYHGHTFNNHDIGIEIDGYFAGVEGDLSTFWKPSSRPDRRPMTPSTAQVTAALGAIEWCMREVEKRGGKIQFIHAHRQSSKDRPSDPGSYVWQHVGMVAKKKWGLKDGGPSFTAGGYPIPREWDPTYTARYRSW